MGIPHKIHYCWFGSNPKPEVFEQCIASWKKYMPDWEIIEWNDDNFDVSFCQYAQQAYADKKWAFLSDVARLKILYDHGGIYFDTDVEITRSWEHLETYDAFFFFQAYDMINTGMGFGSVPGHPLVKKMMEDYQNIPGQYIPCPNVNTPSIKAFLPGFSSVNKTQDMDNTIFFSSNEFYGIGHNYATNTWMKEETEALQRFAKKKSSWWRIQRKLQSPAAYEFLEMFCTPGMIKVYTFAVHDLIDYGIKYWVIRAWDKLTRKIFRRG